MDERWRGWVERMPGWGWTLAMAGVVLVVALAPRLAGLAGATPGFTQAEATNALFARQISTDSLPIFFGGETDASAPLFPYVVKATGTIAGWGVTGPRLAAVMLGSMAAVACALWYSLALGRWWGLAGGVLVGASFWQVLFSTQAIAPVATTFATALGLWCAWEGLSRPTEKRQRFNPWFPAAGVAFGLGFYAHVSYLVIPAVVLISTAFLTVTFRREDRQLLSQGGAIMLGVMVLVMTPLAGYYLENTADFRREVEQFGELPETISSTRDDYFTALEVIAWRGPDSASLNLPGRALLDPLLVIWGLLGIAVALRYPLRPLHGMALLWLIFLPMPISLIDPDNPALYLPLAPVLFAFPLIGMRWLTGFVRARSRPLRLVAAVAVIASVAASAAWSTYDYFWLWADSDEAYEAMRGDVRDSVEAVDELPDDDIPAYIGAAGAERIVRYLASEGRPIRLIPDRDMLPMPAGDTAYLAYGRSTAPDPTLQRYLAGAGLLEAHDGPDGEPAVWLRVLDERTREQLPYSVPTTFFPNGYAMPGFDIVPDLNSTPESPSVDVIVLFRTPADGDPATAKARLDPPGDAPSQASTSGEIRIVPWKNNPPGYDEFILARVSTPFPQTPEMIADLLVALSGPAGEALPPYGESVAVRDDVYVFLNRIGFQSGAQ